MASDQFHRTTARDVIMDAPPQDSVQLVSGAVPLRAHNLHTPYRGHGKPRTVLSESGPISRDYAPITLLATIDEPASADPGYEDEDQATTVMDTGHVTLRRAPSPMAPPSPGRLRSRSPLLAGLGKVYGPHEDFGRSGPRVRAPLSGWSRVRHGAAASLREHGLVAYAAVFVLGFVTAVAMFAGLASLVRTRTARVGVFVAGAGHAALDRFHVVVDGQELCSTRPCDLRLASGQHSVMISADGYWAQEQQLGIAPGSSLALNVTLRKDPGVGANVRLGAR